MKKRKKKNPAYRRPDLAPSRRCRCLLSLVQLRQVVAVAAGAEPHQQRRKSPRQKRQLRKDQREKRRKEHQPGRNPVVPEPGAVGARAVGKSPLPKGHEARNRAAENQRAKRRAAVGREDDVVNCSANRVLRLAERFAEQNCSALGRIGPTDNYYRESRDSCTCSR